MRLFFLTLPIAQWVVQLVEQNPKQLCPKKHAMAMPNLDIYNYLTKIKNKLGSYEYEWPSNKIHPVAAMGWLLYPQSQHHLILYIQISNFNKVVYLLFIISNSISG